MSGNVAISALNALSLKIVRLLIKLLRNLETGTLNVDLLFKNLILLNQRTRDLFYSIQGSIKSHKADVPT